MSKKTHISVSLDRLRYGNRKKYKKRVKSKVTDFILKISINLCGLIENVCRKTAMPCFMYWVYALVKKSMLYNN